MKKIFYSAAIILLALLTNSCEKEVSVSKPEEPPQNSGKIYIGSIPPHAAIFINNKNSGYFTPDTVTYLDDGNQKVTLKLEFYKDSSEIVTVHKDSTSSIFFDYINNPTMRGYLYLDSNPRSAAIFINDSLLDKTTPITIGDLLPGEYSIRMEMDGYWHSNSVAQIRSNKTERISVNLKDTLMWVNYNTGHGIPIPTDYLTCVAADGNTVWAGSFEGLIKYENNEWKLFNTNNSMLPANHINRIIVDEQRNKWICTEGGLVKINGESWTIYNSSNSGLPDNNVISVAFESSTTMWIGLKSAGVVKFDGVNWVIYDHSNSPLRTNDINSVAVGPDGTKWFCTKGGGITKFYADSLWKTYDAYNSAPRGSGEPGGSSWFGFPNDNIQCINFDVNDTAWIGIGIGTGPMAGNDGGSAYFKGPVYWKTYFRTPGKNILSITKDHNGILWFANAEGGLSKYDGGFHTFTTANSNLENNRIYDVAEDESHNLWLASYGSGLIKYKGNH